MRVYYVITTVALIAAILFTVALRIPIKGNGSSMKYHLLGCPSYKATVVGNDRGDRYFFSEKSAQANGFKKAKNCK